jgi:RNA polymerase sigma-70 factor (ECF subfamily)
VEIPGRWRKRKPTTTAQALSSMVDEELAGLASIDPLAFAEIYERYVDGIYGYCARRLGSREIAEDATSLVFSRALAAIGRFQPRSTVRSWLFTIAHNIITDQYRNAAKSQELPLDETWDTIDDEPTPEDTAILKENQDMVRQLLTFLSPDQRRVVELRLADLTGSEIQQVLGKTRSWVNTTQFRAVQRMRAALDEMGGESHA